MDSETYYSKNRERVLANNKAYYHKKKKYVPPTQEQEEEQMRKIMSWVKHTQELDKHKPKPVMDIKEQMQRSYEFFGED